MRRREAGCEDGGLTTEDTKDTEAGEGRRQKVKGEW